MAFWILPAITLIYAVFGEPTPDSPGVTEGLIAVMLLALCGAAGMMNSFTPTQHDPFWMSVLRFLFLFGLIVPTLTGVFSGHAPGLILRDLIPFFFLALPLLARHRLISDGSFRESFLRLRRYIMALTAAGLILAIRSIPQSFDLLPAIVPAYDPLAYLANSPLVLLAACLMFLGGLEALRRSANAGNFLTLAGLWCLTVLPLLAMAIAQQRAGLGFFALVVTAALLIFRFRSHMLLALFAASLLALAAAFWPQIAGTVSGLSRKTSEVGLNMRAQEWASIWGLVSGNPFTLLFGIGWGGTFASPAVGGISVGFAHGLFPYMLLKTGLAGLSLSAIFIAALLHGLLNHPARLRAFVMAGPLLIPAFFYASFKSLDYGLFLLALSGFLHPFGTRQVAS